MSQKNRFTSGALLVIALLLITTSATAWWWNDDNDTDASQTGEARALNWQDLVPEGFEPAQDPTMDMSREEIAELFNGSAESNARIAEIDKALRYAPVEPSLDGQHVTLPGYVVPLEFDGQTRVEEFLLVPYFGACIHTPPPPANQVVMAKLERATEIGDTYEPVQLRGILRTETSNTDLAETGYTMQVLEIGPLPD